MSSWGYTNFARKEFRMIYKAEADFEGVDSNFKDVLLWVRCYQTATAYHGEIVHERVN